MRYVFATQLELLMTPFILGVNYWPQNKAMSWWSDFDADEVRADFALIRSLGMSVVRIFLLWDDWQPTPDTVSETCLTNLGVTCDIAAEHGLKLDVTFFTGHMSGPNWAPRWMLDADEKPLEPGRLVSGGEIVSVGYRNMYTDEMSLDAARLLLKTVVSAYKNHDGIGIWNLGNEPDLFAIAPTQDIGNAWVREMVGIIKAIDPVHDVTCGLHSASLYSTEALRIDQTYAATDIAVMHSYPMYVDWLSNPLDPDYVPFTCALTTALCGKPTLMEEFGGATIGKGKAAEVWHWSPYGVARSNYMANEEEFADYIRQSLHKLVEVGATGAMLWCFADYAEALYDKPPCAESIHERFFGLIRTDRSLKPHAEVIRDFAATQPTVQPATRPLTLDITPEEFYENPAQHTVRLYHAWMGLI